MHEYIEIQFRHKGKPFRVARQVQRGSCSTNLIRRRAASTSVGGI